MRLKVKVMAVMLGQGPSIDLMGDPEGEGDGESIRHLTQCKQEDITACIGSGRFRFRVSR